MAVKAHFAVAKLSKFFNDGAGIAANQKDAWREAQLAIYNHFVLTCDDRAATTLQSVDATKDDRGLAAFKALQDKYGDAKRAQLSKLIKRFFKRKQNQNASAADYFNDVNAGTLVQK